MDSSPSKAATAPTDFPQLQSLSNDQLQELLLNKEAFQKLADSLIEESQPLHVSRELPCIGSMIIPLESSFAAKKRALFVHV